MTLCFSCESNPFLIQILPANSAVRAASSLRSEKGGCYTAGAWLFSRGLGQDFGNVAFHFDAVPDAFEFAVGADQKGAADDAQERAAEESFHAARAVGFDRFEIGVAEEVEV